MKIGSKRTKHAKTYYTSVVSTFSPSDIAGLKVWLKADALSLSNNDPVTTWTDSSGTGNSLTQGTAGAKPTYKTNIFNGQPAISFDGGDFLQKASPTGIPGNAAWSLFVVFSQSEVSPAWKYIINWAVSGFPAGQYVHIISPHGNAGGEDEALWGFGSNGFYGGSGLNDGVPKVGILTHNGSNAQVGYINNVSIGTGAYSPSSWTPNSFSLGGSGAGEFVGYIAEVILYDSLLSSGDRGNVYSYLATKYSTS